MKRALGSLAVMLLALVGLVLVGAPAHADDDADIPVETPVEVSDPDYSNQPDWAWEWRDMSHTVHCTADGSGARNVTQRMFRPAEPSWDGAEWVSHDDGEWTLWDHPDAQQWYYADLQHGDCDTPVDVPVDVPADPGPIDEPIQHPAELAETGGALPWWVTGIAVALAAGGGALVVAGRRRMEPV